MSARCWCDCRLFRPFMIPPLRPAAGERPLSLSVQTLLIPRESANRLRKPDVPLSALPEMRNDGFGEPLEHFPVLFVRKHSTEIIEAERLIATQRFCHALGGANCARILCRLQDSTGSQSL